MTTVGKKKKKEVGGVKGRYVYEHHFTDKERESQKGFHITQSLNCKGRIQTLALNSRVYRSASVWTMLYCPVLLLPGL